MSKSKVKQIPLRVPESEAIIDQLDFTTEDYSEACKRLKREYKRLIKFIINDLKLKDNSKVLEIGPGPGWIGIMLAQLNPTLEIIGLEISEDMIRVANKNKQEGEVMDKITYINGDAKKMVNLKDNSFDLVFGNGTLHHWDDPIKVFNEISRILKKDGIFCISDGRRDIGFGAKVIFHMVKWFIPKFMRQGWKTSILAGYTPEELRSILINTKLKEAFELKTDLFDLIVYSKTHVYSEG